MVGDGYCNDETNKIQCAFDGGDCCYSCVNKEFCKKCLCLNEDDGENINPLIGDGYCQDGINNANCSFDGGDCCGSCIITSYCTNCSCIGDVTDNGVLSRGLGDGFCNDETNNVVCNYDNGDCCLTNLITDHCKNCTCHLLETCAAGFLPPSVGDGYCNDKTNNPHCYYDGLDCCRSPINTDSCSDCLCHGESIILQNLSFLV